MCDDAIIRAQWSLYPPLRLAYGEKETGDGRVLDATKEDALCSAGE